ncbi:MAG: hypothetical protein AAF591_01390 [Verrucomicrobiota bacterium]
MRIRNWKRVVGGAAIVVAMGVGSLLADTRAIKASTVFGEAPVLTTKNVGHAYADQSLRRNLGMIFRDSEVVLLAYTDKAFLVRGEVAGKGREYWISVEAFTPLPREVVEVMNLGIDRVNEVTELVAKNQVALGMTEAEVRRSLGAPDKKVERISARGKEVVWEYYERTTDVRVGADFGVRPYYGFRRGHFYNGFPRYRSGFGGTIFVVRDEERDMAVNFRDGVVVSIEKTR